MHVASIPVPASELHLALTFRDDTLIEARFQPTAAAPHASLSPGARRTLEKVTRHLETGREDLSDVPVDLSGLPPFRKRVLEALRAVPAGEVLTYGELAARVGRPGAARAVGGAMAGNPIPVVVPCHRIVPSGGPLGAYSGSGGPDTKRALLRREGVTQW